MSELRIETDGAVETWTIDGEARRNALSRALVAELTAQLERLSRPPRPVAVVLTGAGQKAFCAGADLKERAGMSRDEVEAFLTSLGQLLRGLERSSTVFVAYLNGAALGGGTELALACDIRLAAPHAELGLTEVKLGIIPGAGGTQRLPRLVGPGVARELIFTGRRVGADEAVKLGLVSRVGSLPEAQDVARDIAANAPLALAAAKHAVDEGLSLPMDEALAVERRCYARTLDTQDRLEGLAAFAEKRPPRFQGR